MKSIHVLVRLILLSALLGIMSPVYAMDVSAVLQSAAVANGNGTEFIIGGNSSVALTVNCAACGGGTTVNFEGSEDGTNYSAVSATLVGTTTTATSTTTSGIGVWQMSGAGLVKIRARISAYSAGTITVTGHAIQSALGLRSAASAGGGSPGGLGTALQYRVDATTFGGVLGSLVDNGLSGVGNNRAQVSLAQTWTDADNTHSLHLFEPTATYTGPGIPNTIAADYNSMIFKGTGGALHIGASMHRGYDGGIGGNVVNWDLNYSDFSPAAGMTPGVTPTNSIASLVFYNAVGGSLNGGPGNTFTRTTGFQWIPFTLAGSTAFTLEEGADFGIPASADTRKTSVIGVSIGGGRDPNNYDALVIDSGMSYFKQGIKQSLTLDSTLFVAPITTGGVPVGGIVAGLYQSNFPTAAQSAANINSLMTAPNGITGSLFGDRQIVDNGGNGLVALLNPFYSKCSNSGGATTTACEGATIDTPANGSGGTLGSTTGLRVKTQASGIQTTTPVAIKTEGAADLVSLAGPTITNGGHGISLTSQTTITAGAAVKIDTANNSSAVLCAITDTTGCTGFAQNAATAGQTVYVLTTGNIATPVLGTGTCTKGQFVINDSTTAGRVKCTSTYTAGTVLGWATIAQAAVGSAVGVDIQVR